MARARFVGHAGVLYVFGWKVLDRSVEDINLFAVKLAGAARSVEAGLL